VIKILFKIKRYNDKDLVREFPCKGWKVGLVYKMLQKLWIIFPAAADDAVHAHTDDNIDIVYELALHEREKINEKKYLHTVPNNNTLLFTKKNKIGWWKKGVRAGEKEWRHPHRHCCVSALNSCYIQILIDNTELWLSQMHDTLELRVKPIESTGRTD